MSYVVSKDKLPPNFPTHRHSSEFWEALGRAVGSFGFLEQTLGRAIFALTATKHYDETEIAHAYVKWITKLKHALSDPLGNLIDSYSKALKEVDQKTFDACSELISSLRKASTLRNVICHGSWQLPDENGASIPFYVDRKTMSVFDTAMNAEYLRLLRSHVAELSSEIVSSVTVLGLQFPGSKGPGKPIWPHPVKR